TAASAAAASSTRRSSASSGWAKRSAAPPTRTLVRMASGSFSRQTPRKWRKRSDRRDKLTSRPPPLRAACRPDPPRRGRRACPPWRSCAEKLEELGGGLAHVPGAEGDDQVAGPHPLL